MSKYFRESTETDARKRAIIAIENALNPPTPDALKTKHIRVFRDWCRENAIDPDKVTTGGKAFQRCLAELDRKASEAKTRLASVGELIRVAQPLAVSFEAMAEVMENEGWNDCIFQYVKEGVIPKMQECAEKEFNDSRFWKEGYNEAREALSRAVGVPYTKRASRRKKE